LSAYQLPVWVWPTALLGVGALAVWRGRDTERLGAATVLANWAITTLVYRAGSDDTQWGILAVDGAQFAVFILSAFGSRRHWPLFAAGFGLLQLLTHGAKTLDTAVSAWAYITAQIIWSYLILIAIGYGAWTAPRRYAEMEADLNEAPPGRTLR
jgi:hypothetical protein